MPLAGYPAETLFPAGELYPGLQEVRAIFRTPTQDIAFPMEGSLHALLPHALSVWRAGGVWGQGFAPPNAIVAAADRFYRGGYDHPVDEDAVLELTSAGYGDNIIILEVLA